MLTNLWNQLRHCCFDHLYARSFSVISNVRALNTNIQSLLRTRHSDHFVEILFFKLNQIECVENVLLITVDYRRRWIITIFLPSRSMHSRQMVDSLRWVRKPSTIKCVILIARAGVFNEINMTAVTFNTCILYCFALSSLLKRDSHQRSDKDTVRLFWENIWICNIGVIFSH